MGHCVHMVVPSNSMCTIPYVLQEQLVDASRSGNIEMVGKLLEQGVRVDCRVKVSTNIPHIVHEVFGKATQEQL